MTTAICVHEAAFHHASAPRGETDLGNGLIGFGRYEWDVDILDNNEDVVDRTPTSIDPDAGGEHAVDNDDIAVRLRYVGVKGDWGSVDILVRITTLSTTSW